MKKAICAAACLLLTAQTPSNGTEKINMPVSEELKVRALQMGYWLNGNSMVRPPSLGSIDVSEILLIPDLSSIPGKRQGEKVRPAEE
jgi:hypothetical protein